MSFLIILKVLFMTIIASIFLITDRSIIGLRFLTGPLGLFGFGRGIKCPRLISTGLIPVSAVWFSISAIFSKTISGLFFNISAFRSSHPGLLLFFNLFTACSTSRLVISSSNFWGLISGIGVVLFCLTIFSK